MIAEFLCSACQLIFIGSPDNEIETHHRKVDNDGVDHGECGGLGVIMGVWG